MMCLQCHRRYICARATMDMEVIHLGGGGGGGGGGGAGAGAGTEEGEGEGGGYVFAMSSALYICVRATMDMEGIH